MLPPTGRQLTLTSGDSTATVVELGAGLRSFSVAGRDLVDGYAEDAPVSACRGQHCAPWPNRVRDGRWSWAGEQYELPVNEPTRRTALHGLVRWQPWTVEDVTGESARLSTLVLPQPGWPGTLRMEVFWRVSAGRLDCEVSAANLGRDASPFGYAAHPYLTAATSTIDEALLQLPAAGRMDVDPERLLPDGPGSMSPVAGTPYDFRTPHSLAGIELDTCFGNLHEGRAQVLDGDGRGVELLAGGDFRWLQVYTGDDLPDVAQRRCSIAVEPMTCPPDALRSGRDLIVLEPGQTWQGEWGLRAVG